MRIRLTSRPGVRALGWLALAAVAVAPASAIDTKIASPIFGHGVIFKANGNVLPEGRIFANMGNGGIWPTGVPFVNGLSGEPLAAFANNDLFLNGSIKTNQSSFPGRTRFKKADGTVMASIDDAGNLYVQGTIEDVSLCVAPVTELEKWNSTLSVQLNNNCYNYANNQATYTNASPGLASTGVTTSVFTVTAVRASALKDGLTWVGWNFPGNDYTCPNAGTLVFMTVAPGSDYHWYRLDKANGKWTHKLSSAPASDLDASHQPILNPLLADRKYENHNYTDNGGFYCTCGGDANIR